LIKIESEVIFGPGVVISAGNHQFLNNSFRFSKSKPLNVTIKRGSWIAANCTIVGECVFPTESILAANSVFIKKSINKPNSLYGGNPARVIKSLKIK
jgi:acetyltransferase-like isoleucine patch superfamily enzyme